MSDRAVRLADEEPDATTLLPPAADGTTPETLWETLSAKLNAIPKEQHFDIDVPGYDGLLALRTVPVPPTTQAKLNERVARSRSPEREFWLHADYLIAATSQVLGRVDTEQPFQPLLDDEGEPYRIEEALARRMKMPADVTTARRILLLLFGGAPSPEMAIRSAAVAYGEWASNEIDVEALTGES